MAKRSTKEVADARDELFDEVVAYVKAQGESSVSGIQREFPFGFARAGRLAKQMRDAGLVFYDPGRHGKTIIWQGRRPKSTPQDSEIERLLPILQKHPKTFAEICDQLGLPPGRTRQLIDSARDAGHVIGQFDSGQLYYDATAQQVRFKKQPRGKIKDHFIFAVMSDIHTSSTACMEEEIGDFVEIAYKEGVREIIIPGDVFAGQDVYKHQLQELKYWKRDDQRKHANKIIPVKKGLKYYAIGGNHDTSFLKKDGGDILRDFAADRKDFTYLGNVRAWFPLHGALILLHHPRGRGAYSKFYKLQNYVRDNVPVGNEPAFFFQGHYHDAVQIKFRGIFCYHPGCFEGETLFTLEQGFNVEPGGYIIEVWLDEANVVRRLRNEFIPYQLPVRVVVDVDLEREARTKWEDAIDKPGKIEPRKYTRREGGQRK